MSKKPKTVSQKIRTVDRWKKFVMVLEVICSLIFLMAVLIYFVPGAKTQVMKYMTTTSAGKQIIKWFGSKAYSNSVLDTDFNSEDVAVNDLEYDYAEEYTDFVLFGVDSRSGELDSSNSDSILIVSIHNTTGKVRMVSVYRDTYMGIYDTSGNLSQYFKVNSAFSYGGATAAINTLNKNLDLNITDYVTVNFAGVVDIIDALGGIEVNLTEDELYQLNYHIGSTISSTGISSSKVTESGENIKLDGVQAATYCRIRKATFYDPDTGEAISNDFGRAARQRLVMEKLIEAAKEAGVTELESLVAEVLDEDIDDDDRVISTSFEFDEILNLIPVLFDFELDDTAGFPSTLTTSTINGVSYVIAQGFESNVAALHEFLYDEEDYTPTSTVSELAYAITNYTGISEYSAGYDPLDTDDDSTEYETEAETEADYDYDDGWDSEYY